MMSFFLAQAATPLPEIKDIAPPFAIPLLPLWAIILLTVLGTLLACWLGWLLWRRIKKREIPPLPPRQAALGELQMLEARLENDAPLDLVVQIAGVLRRYVVGQFGIPATRQTSYEFLQSSNSSPAFNPGERENLKSFLDKCDLIEFARQEASAQDSVELWQQARTFVAGENP